MPFDIILYIKLGLLSSDIFSYLYTDRHVNEIGISFFGDKFISKVYSLDVYKTNILHYFVQKVTELIYFSLTHIYLSLLLTHAHYMHA